MKLCGWENRRSGETKGQIPSNGKALAFSGQQVVSPALFQEMPEAGAFSIIDTYLGLAPSGAIIGHVDQSSIWKDVGKPQELYDAAGLLPSILF